MTSNDNSQRREGPFRVDLTSQDLRTGTIRLPRQLLNRFDSGLLQATADDTEAELQLEFRAPRELHGLRQFFDDNNLRTNDALNLYLTTAGVHLEPFYRNRRRSEVRNQRRTSAAGRHASQSEPEKFQAAESAVPDVTGADAATPGSADQVSEASEPETTEMDGAADTPPGGTDTAAEPADAEASELEGAEQPPGSGDRLQSSEADPFDDFGDFDDLGELDPLELDLDPGTPDPVITPIEQPPQDSRGAAAEEPVAAPAPNPASDAYHVVARRPFSLTHSTAPHDAQQAAGMSAKQPAETIGAPTASQPTTAGAGDAVAQVRRYLNEPGLPSILQETQVVAALGLSADEVASALSRISQDPDSRLSVIRAGFWLLKQPEQD